MSKGAPTRDAASHANASATATLAVDSCHSFNRLSMAAAADGLATRGWLAVDARIYVERRARDPLPALPSGWREQRSGRAGEVGYHLFAS